MPAAYRWALVYSPHRHYHGFRWYFLGEKAEYYADNILCFGLANALATFHRIFFSIVRMMRQKGFSVPCYIDDFLLIEHDFETCQQAQHSIISLLIKLSFVVKWDKVLGPTTRIPFLGLILDSVKQRVELPAERGELSFQPDCPHCDACLGWMVGCLRQTKKSEDTF